MNRLKQLFRRRRLYDDLDQEIAAHLAERTAELVAGGMPAKEAAGAARREFGNLGLITETAREAWGWRWLEDLLADLRFGARMLLKFPGFTLTVILTLALSVGANTAIFSLVNALLLKNLPYPYPERMGTIYTRISGGAKPSDERHSLNGEQWELLRDQVPALISGLSGSTTGVNLKAGSAAEYVHNGRVSAHYFDA